MAVDHRKTVAKGAGLSLIGRFISVVFGMFFRRYMNIFFGEIMTGLFYLCYSIVNFLSPFAQCGIPGGVGRFVGIARQREDWPAARGALLGGLQIAAVSTGIVVLLLVFFTPEVVAVFTRVGGRNVAYSDEMARVLRVYAVFLFPTVLLAVVLAAHQALRTMWTTFALEYVYIPAMWLVAAVVIGYTYGSYCSHGIAILVSSFIVIVTLALICALWSLRWMFPQLLSIPARYARRQMLSFSLPLMLQSAVRMLVNADVLMVGYFLGFENVMVYSFAIAMAKQSGVVRDAFGSLFSPLVAGIHDTGDMTQLGHLYHTTIRWCIMCAVPLICLQFIMPDVILHILNVVNAPEAYKVIRVVLVAQLFSIMIGSSGQVLIMTGHPRLSLYNNVIAVILNVVLNLLFIPRFGIFGAGFATAIAVLVKNILDIACIGRLLHISPFALSHVPVLGCCAVASVVTYVARQWTMALPWWQSLLICSAVFGVVYVPCIIVVLTREDRAFFWQIWGRIRGK